MGVKSQKRLLALSFVRQTTHREHVDQSSESVYMARASVEEIVKFANDIQVKADRYVRASQSLKASISQNEAATNIVVPEASLQEAVESLAACKQVTEKSVEFITNKMVTTKVKVANATSDDGATSRIESFSLGIYMPEEELQRSSPTEQAKHFPPEIQLDHVNHVRFVIHDETTIYERVENLVVPNFNDFREKMSAAHKSHFKDIPLALDIVPIAWRAEVHTPVTDKAFESISPAEAKGWRDLDREYVMDILYYSAPSYRQKIDDAVAKQMNAKYNTLTFQKSNPSWNRRISIFAHSLGSLIAYDILTHQEPNRTGENRVVYPKLDFQVENLFCAGSPVPVFALSRGDVAFDKARRFKAPAVENYFNILHPDDPVASRVEPFLHDNVPSKPTVDLTQLGFLKKSTFGEMVHAYHQMMASLRNASNKRIDFEFSRSGWYMEKLVGASSHFAYWAADDVINMTLVTMCRPVVDDVLTPYLNANKTLPTLRPRHVVPFTPHVDIQLAAKIDVLDGFTDKWLPQAVYLGSKCVYITSNSLDLKQVQELALSALSTANNTDDNTIQVQGRTKHSMVLQFHDKEEQGNWFTAIRGVLDDLKSGKVVPSRDTEVTFFGAKKTGMLDAGSGFFSTKNWFVLTKTNLICFDQCPAIDAWEKFSFETAFMKTCAEHVHFRLVNSIGTSATFKVHKLQSGAWKSAIEKDISISNNFDST
ncbi:Aste57867_10827 [Aphanomyces stellatus]|uniref:Aste57867_10827 protein n=1 Tax=Aphanomyces stellatus TaxID=120398 RepID=A0A485KRC6_9STRA|nr:hypothetical protein As57867_010787 [Aphanomyces stellatus]VFT87695.1 Aste57867_10827 [Aphanomyces stellatus]